MPRTLLPLLRRPTAPPVSMLLVLLLGAGWVYRGCSVPVSSRWAPHAAQARVAAHGAVCESAVHVVATDPISEGDRTCDTQAGAPDWSFPQVPTRVCVVSLNPVRRGCSDDPRREGHSRSISILCLKRAKHTSSRTAPFTLPLRP